MNKKSNLYSKPYLLYLTKKDINSFLSECKLNIWERKSEYIIDKKYETSRNTKKFHFVSKTIIEHFFGKHKSHFKKTYISKDGIIENGKDIRKGELFNLNFKNKIENLIMNKIESRLSQIEKNYIESVRENEKLLEKNGEILNTKSLHDFLVLTTSWWRLEERIFQKFYMITMVDYFKIELEKEEYKMIKSFKKCSKISNLKLEQMKLLENLNNIKGSIFIQKLYNDNSNLPMPSYPLFYMRPPYELPIGMFVHTIQKGFIIYFYAYDENFKNFNSLDDFVKQKWEENLNILLKNLINPEFNKYLIFLKENYEAEIEIFKKEWT